jgi:ubiquinone/menaquinone biosynthesis C-methylase UbiE
MSDNVMNTSYEPFSKEPEYIEVNRLFIQSLQLDAHQVVLDLACGTGTLTELILREMQLRHPTAGGDGMGSHLIRIVGLDISRDSLKLAYENLIGLGFLDRSGQLRSSASDMGRSVIALAEASADRLPIANLSMDAVVIGNAIQLFADKDKVFSDVNRVLCAGGLFAFNTSFYAGTYVPGTELFYIRWIEEAISHIKKKDEELKKQGLQGIPRRRGLANPAFSRPWLAQHEYEALLERHGFEVRSVVERTVLLTQRSFETIGAYAGLASVLLSGYPVQLACEALEKSAGPALAALNKEAIPRYWIELVAFKKQS